MKILFADQFSDPGGAQQCLMDLLPGVLERGWHPLVMAPGDGELLQWCRNHGIPTRPLPLLHYSAGAKSLADGLRFALNRPQLRRAIRAAALDHGCDLIYVNGPRLLPVVAGLGLRTLFHAHNRIGGRFSRAFAAGILEREKIPVMAVSQFVAGQFPSHDVSVVYNGVADCASAKTDPGAELRIGMLGRIAPEKGHLDFLRAARLVPQLRYEIFGAPLFSGDEYEQAVRNESAGLPVTFHGWQKPAAALTEMDVLAVPSGPDEGAARVILEAFSAGVPVVAYAAGGIPEFIRHGQTGLLTETSSPENLAALILQLAHHPELRQRLSQAARAEWCAQFTLAAYRQRVCDRIQRRASR